MAKKYNSLAHTKYYTRYHIVFTPKYRRKAIYARVRADIRDIVKHLCMYKGYLKGKSALEIFDKHANLKYKYGNRHFWSEGYYVSTVGINESTVKKYIQEQERADIAQDKLSVKEYEDPFGEDKEVRKQNKR